MNEKIASLMETLEVTRKGAERIAAIVEAGAEMLLEEGFPSLTKRRIANRLGISHGNVSYYFPTRQSLWHAVMEYCIREIYDRHHAPLSADTENAQAKFDEFVVRWIDEYNDPTVRIFFSHVIATAEVNASVAKVRNELYENFYKGLFDRAKALDLGVDEAELEQRVLEAMAVLEGLHAVSAFRPALVGQSYEFRKRLLGRVNAIVRGA